MPSIDKKYYHNLDLDSNEIKAGRIYNLTTTQRTALSLSTADKGYLVYDTTLLSLFVWNGTAWTSAGGGSQNLQQVTTTGNTTTNNIILNSTSGEYPNNAISQNIITDSSININFSDIVYNLISILGANSLLMSSVTNTITTNSTISGNILNLNYYDSVNSDDNGIVELGAVDFFGSSYLALTNKLSQAGYLKVTNLTNNNVVLQFPNKATGDYTIATINDIPQSVGFEQNFLLMGA